MSINTREVLGQSNLLWLLAGRGCRLDTFINVVTLFGYLNVKCSLKAQLFEHLVPRQQSCLEELWKYQEMEPCWRKGVTGDTTEVVYTLA